jgi:hypothetical protein
MPRYHFYILDGQNTQIRNEGLELHDRQAAWSEATTSCGELLRDLDGQLKPGDKWSMKVKDENGADVYELEFNTKEFF